MKILPLIILNHHIKTKRKILKELITLYYNLSYIKALKVFFKPSSALIGIGSPILLTTFWLDTL